MRWWAMEVLMSLGNWDSSQFYLNLKGQDGLDWLFHYFISLSDYHANVKMVAYEDLQISWKQKMINWGVLPWKITDKWKFPSPGSE